ncbi:MULTISPECIES: hypothetical protein [Thermus]|jgi:hypothetical protein|uniref:Uncharacterized protein n=1 Tax=Thermus scotoductus TaxID=37636 RepID=A0A430RDN0_THESC|nr:MULTISPECIES: hypothetical protein [Thermus]MCS6869598.1 hypothetical protein [Thermus sp.]MCX7850177.1 hypothetical protein [Thermus sp.]MDW8017189.1 hypothetical protein [Thermus sp.]MDW8357643.1 hypothetical protein [Thermus sp.]RTH05476.1 hypothetical protein CSW47_05185 [Thermus scotoductus]
MRELKLTPEQAVALLNLLQAERDYEGHLPKTLEEVREALRTWLKEEGLARKSPTGSYYLVRR